MLQTSQIEKPICSATIDQIRLRRAIRFPRVSQNASSSGCQSDIQLVCRLRIESVPVPAFDLFAEPVSDRAGLRCETDANPVPAAFRPAGLCGCGAATECL